jgi:hypothetical protein
LSPGVIDSSAAATDRIGIFVRRRETQKIDTRMV